MALYPVRMAVLAATILLGPAGTVTAQHWGVAALDAGLDLMSSRHASVTGSSYSARLRIGSLARVPRVDLALGWVSGSGTYSPFNCHLARQVYCFGGSETIAGGELAFQAEGQPLNRILGMTVTPVASIGATRIRSRISETEGPTLLCFENGQLVSCADNPPFQQFTDDRTSTLPSFGFGLALTRPTGPVDVRLAMTGHRAGIYDAAFTGIRFSVGLGF